MEIKQSLLMPKTNFEMRGNLNKKEPLLVEKWQQEDLYHEMLDHSTLGEYVLHDGPPYANGNMHCGHMLNRILKDFVVRFRAMQGYKTPFVFGWDTHGLPIENMVTKSGVNRKTTPIVEFRQKCEEYARKQVANQKEQIRRLGVVGDFDNPYLTLNKDYEASEIHCFSEMALKGLIYKGLKPVYWSPSSESALAEAEIEYFDVKAYTCFVAFKVKDGKDVVPQDARFVIWTTTPWTLPANLAICANPEFVYGLYDTNLGKLVFLTDLANDLTEKLGLTKCELIREYKGTELDGLEAYHPFYDRVSLLINADYVTKDSGTGLVHIAPGHGVDDYNACVKYGIKPYCPVDEHGYLTADAGERLAGKFYEDANAEVLKMLEETGALLKEEDIIHSYPHDWRTHKPVIFRATPQWFCSISPIRDEIIAAIHEVEWSPKWGEQRMVNMIKDRNDWCISRQRVWGVPIPIIYCEDGTPIIEKEVFDHIEALVKEKGSNCWFELSEKELLPEGYTNAHSPNGEFRKEKDIMDVWFDSGSSFNGTLNARGISYPADLYLEGSDQYRGWFNSSLIISVALFGKAPYKKVTSHGFVMDENWDKMSKSKGNGIDPLKIANTYGADILRLWTAMIDYHQDVRISENLIKQVTETYRKIRNTFKFMLGTLSNTSVEDHFKTEEIQEELEPLDKYILAKLEQVKNNFIKYMDDYNFLSAMSEIMKFISDDVSSLYLSVAKDILYCDEQDSTRRLQMQTVINEVLFTLMRLLNPVLPFTMDEVNKNYCLKTEENVQFYKYPEITNKYSDSVLEDYELVRDLIEDVSKALENARNEKLIGSSQEAIVNLEIKDTDLKEILEDFDEEELEHLFIVSKVNLVEDLEGTELNTCVVNVKKHDGIKCDRCWNYINNDEVVEIEGAHLCPRCLQAMKK